MNPSVDLLVTVSLAILLLLKYIFYDKPVTNSMSNDKPVSSVTPKISTENPFNDKDITAAYFRKRRISINSVSAVILRIIMTKIILKNRNNLPQRFFT